MSKFEQICERYTNARKAFLEYEEVCRNFARDLIYGMIDYYEWPRDQEITYIPLGEEIGPNDRFYALAGAMRMDDQAFWHFGVELAVHERGGSHPLPFLMSFFIKKIGPHFIVKLGPNGREIKIHEERQRELQPFYDAVYVQIIEFFAKKYQDAITNQQKEIGFITLSPKVASGS
ncbi:MAG: hypothetical protein KC419_25280 [Anaerolineales bacterium]|nr:hypothetical protein [Anaerolineales bacterium]MCA9931831.1 hypothetical protein [Anaerolineales bacterium]